MSCQHLALQYISIGDVPSSFMAELVNTRVNRYPNLPAREASVHSKTRYFPLTTSTSLTSLLTHRRHSQTGLLPYSGGDVRAYQLTKFQRIVSNLDEHLGTLQLYMEHSKEWKYNELRHILDEQEYFIEDLEGEIERREEQINKKSQEINEIREDSTEIESRLNESYEANRRYREDKIRYEEENQLLGDKLLAQQDIVRRLKAEVRDTDRRIKKLSHLHQAATNRSTVPKKSVKCQTRDNFNLMLLKSDRKVAKTDSSVQVESLKPVLRPLCIDRQTEASL